MAVPKKRRSKSKKASHFSFFLQNFKKLANSTTHLINDLVQKKFSKSFLFVKKKLNFKIFS